MADVVQTFTLDDVLSQTNGRRPTGVGIAAEVALSAHALNNEGSRNNATMPRQVDVIADGATVMVNAVSGDTIKHTFVDHLISVIAETQRGNDGALLPICDPCRLGDPNRLNADEAFRALARDRNLSNADIAAAVIQRCTVTDTAGILVTEGNRNVPRHSTVRFGWQLGIPERVTTGRYTHVKLVPGAADRDEGGGSNLGQNIFTRPASSGEYAFVALADLDRIGVSDVTQQRIISEDAQRARTVAVLEALFRTVISPGGAQRNTQLPHVQEIHGAVSLSFSAIPPILFSPLSNGYIEEMAQCAATFDRGGVLFVVRFASPAELGTILHRLAGLFA